MNSTKKIVFAVTCVLVVSIFCAITTSAVAGTIYESEPNYEFEDADLTYNDYNNYGYISSLYDEDMWKVTFDYSGYANFWLGNIPEGCNYELVVYDYDELEILGTSFNTNNRQELVTIPVIAGKTYYFNVFSINGYSIGSAYLIRAKCYPQRDLQIVLHEQEKEYTCSAASAKMVLSYYGINLSESAIESWMRNNNSSWNVAGNVAAVINHYLSLNGKGFNYVAQWSGSLSEEEYTERLINNICSGYPVIPLITVNDTTYFDRTTAGHYIVVKGLYYDTANYKYLTKINDPFYLYSKVYTSITVSGVYECNMAHPHDFMIFVEQ